MSSRQIRLLERLRVALTDEERNELIALLQLG